MAHLLVGTDIGYNGIIWQFSLRQSVLSIACLDIVDKACADIQSLGG